MRSARKRSASGDGRSLSGAVGRGLLLGIRVAVAGPVGRSSVPGSSGACPLEVAHDLDAHGAHERGLAAIQLRAEDDLAKRAHHALGLPGLEEVDRPERLLPVGEERLPAVPDVAGSARFRGGLSGIASPPAAFQHS